MPRYGEAPAGKALRVRMNKDAGGVQKKRKRAPKLKGIPGIPDDVFRRLVKRDDEYHLTPEGGEWLEKAVDQILSYKKK